MALLIWILISYIGSFFSVLNLWAISLLVLLLLIREDHWHSFNWLNLIRIYWVLWFCILRRRNNQRGLRHSFMNHDCHLACRLNERLWKSWGLNSRNRSKDCNWKTYCIQCMSYWTSFIAYMDFDEIGTLKTKWINGWHGLKFQIIQFMRWKLVEFCLISFYECHSIST